MAPILLLSNPEIIRILPQLKINSYDNDTKIFYLDDIEKGIEMVNSLPTSDTQVPIPIYFISDHLESIENASMDGLLAFLLSLESCFLKELEFQFNWISLEDEKVIVISLVSEWKTVFPFINFTSQVVFNSIQLPQIGQIQIQSDWQFNQFTVMNTFKIIRKEQIKGFLSSSEEVFNLTCLPNFQSKIQMNFESDGILFGLQFNQNIALIFLDPQEKTITFIEPTYLPYLKKFLNVKSVVTSVLDQQHHQQPVNKWLENSFSLTDWTTEESSIDEDSLKKDNKLKLKKLILLSLRGIGIKKSDKNFIDIWKHLYCGCIFSLRKELNTLELDQAVLLKTIKENIKFLNLMLKELLKEEEAAFNDFKNFIKNEPETEETEIIYNSNLKLNGKLEKLVKKSELALKDCEIIESLDKQLRLISETQSTLNNLKNLNRLNNLIISNCKCGDGYDYRDDYGYRDDYDYDCRDGYDLSKLVPLVLEWQINSANSEILNLSESGEITKTFINEKLPKIINEEIEKVINSWTDDIERLDQKSIQILSLKLENPATNPIDCLFASYPLTKLTPLLEYHKVLLSNNNNSNSNRQLPDRLLNRFYDILQQSSKTTEPFSAGQIEDLVSEKMKFTTRISCILESTFNFIKLHPDLKDIFIKKCEQICKQIRKCAKEERDYEAETKNVAILDSQLNEISLILTSLNHFMATNEGLLKELKKWTEIYFKLEEIYLVKGIQQAIQIDQITITSSEEQEQEQEQEQEFPVSSCVDDIFYVLKAAKSRIDKIQSSNSKTNLIQNSLRELFLNVIKKYLDNSIKTLSPLNLNLIVAFKPSRELITTLVLINNLIATKSNWRRVKSCDPLAFEDDLVEKDIKNILFSSLNTGIYEKVLQSSIKKELMAGEGEELFIKVHSLLTIINSLFKTTLAKEALNQLIGLTLSDFSQIFCKELYDNQTTTTTTTTSYSSSSVLRYDRLLHELSNYLEGTLNYPTSDPSLLRLKQSLSLLLAETKSEAQDLVEEWKREGACTLRAGEILLIMNKLK